MIPWREVPLSVLTGALLAIVAGVVIVEVLS